MADKANFTIDRGVEARDVITGFLGRVVCRIDNVTGCNQYLLSPKVDDKGGKVESQWFDEHRLEVTNGTPITLQPQADVQRSGSCFSSPSITK